MNAARTALISRRWCDRLQNILTIAASNAGNGLCGGDGQDVCRLRWSGSDRTVESIVLLASA